MRSLQWSVYKAKAKAGSTEIPAWGAAQFNLAPAHHYCDLCKAKSYTGEVHPSTGQQCSGKMITREGCVFLEMTSASAPDVYDWSNKVIIALSVVDLSKLLVGLRNGTETKIFHDPNVGSDKMGQVKKSLNFVSPKGLEMGGILSVMQTSGEDKKQHKVPLNQEETLCLAVLVQTAIPKCLCWS